MEYRRMDFSMDRLVQLRVPLCVNIMASGQYAAQRDAQTRAEPYFYLNEISRDENIWRLHNQQLEELHAHDYFELMCVLEGRAEQRIENGIYLYSKGEAVLLNRNTRHHEIVGESYILAFICMSREYVKEMLAGHFAGDAGVLPRFLQGNLQNKAAHMKDYLDFSPCRGDAGGDVYDVLDTITQESLLEKPGFEAVLRGLVVRLLATLADETNYTCRHIVLDSSAEGALFEKITALMEAQPGRMGREKLAERLNYNADYLNRVVKKHSGMSLREYNLNLRLKKADKLLVTTDLGITQILEGLGFENRTYFYKLFAARHGMTPGAFRDKYRIEKAR